MTVKSTMTIKPTHYITDKKGKKIAVFRGGQRDTNKYAKLTPREKRDNRHIDDKNYDPTKPERKK